MALAIELSKVVCSSFNIGDPATIKITKGSYTEDGKHKTITHDVGFRLVNGDAVTYIARNVTGTSVTWDTSTVADLLYHAIPINTSGVGYIVLFMKADGKVVSEEVETFRYYVKTSDCAPVISYVSVYDNNDKTYAVTGDRTKLVRWLSKPFVVADVYARKHATLTYTSIGHSGLFVDSAETIFDAVYENKFTLIALDSRNIMTTVEHKVSGFIEYDPAHFTEVSVKRTESTSTAVRVTAKGYCFKGNFGAVDNTLTVAYTCTSLTDGSKTSGTLTGVTWNSDGTFTVSQDLAGFSLKSSYEFVFTVSDKLTQFISEDIILGEAVGDLRIGKDYILSKNKFIVGTETETELKPYTARRVVDGVLYETETGVGNINDDGIPSYLLQLFKNTNGSRTLLGRMDMREDGFLYNALTNMSVAEIMSYAPSIVGGGSHGRCLLNGGDSTPVLLQWGRVNVTPSAANTVTKTPVNFTFPFKGMPCVLSDIASGAPGDISLNVGDISSTGFSLYFERVNTQNISVLWFAIGDGTEALPM